jgi:hypothetical protein
MIHAKSALRWVLLLIVFGSVAVYAWQQSHKPEQQAAPDSPLLDSKVATVVVTYFTTDVRCDSCRTIEKLSRQAIEEGFPNEVASGAVLFRVLNTDRTENQHFVEDYEIANKTVIISHQQNGKETQWLNRQDVWLLLDEPTEFLAYVREPVRRFLGKS